LQEECCPQKQLEGGGLSLMNDTLLVEEVGPWFLRKLMTGIGLRARRGLLVGAFPYFLLKSSLSKVRLDGGVGNRRSRPQSCLIGGVLGKGVNFWSNDGNYLC